MLFSNQYYGYDSRHKKSNRSRKKSRRTENSQDKIINSPSYRDSKHQIRSASLGIFHEKCSDRAFMKHVYNVMSPAKLAKKLSNKINPFHELTAKNIKHSNQEDRSLGIKYQFHRQVLSPNYRKYHQATSHRNSENKIISQNSPQRVERTSQQKNAQLKQIFQRKKKLQEEDVKISKKLYQLTQFEEKKNMKNEGEDQIFQSRKNKNSIIERRASQEYNDYLDNVEGKNQCEFDIQQSIMINERKLPLEDSKLLQASICQNQDYQIKAINPHIISLSPQPQKQQNYFPFAKTPSSRIKKHQQITSPISKKLDIHYRTLHKLQQYATELKILNPERIIAFEREIYLCRRMYYEELKNMCEVLSGKYGVLNCFKFSEAVIQTEEINQYRLRCNNEVNWRLKKIQIEMNQLFRVLSQMSRNLCIKNTNDPYLRLQKNNFEPELVIELFGETDELTQKIKQLKQQDDPTNQRNIQDLINWRHKSMQMILLIGQLKGFLNKDCKILQQHSCQEKQSCYQSMYKNVLEIVDKFQDMPL